MGLRPTFGRVSKYGAMALSWSMDKLGPMCRDATDLALVFDAIRGSDGKDLEVLKDYPFNYEYDVYKVKSLRVGYLKGILKPPITTKAMIVLHWLCSGIRDWK